MTSVVKTNGNEPNGSDRRFRAALQRKLETAVAAAWRECVEECVDERTGSPLYCGDDWLEPLGDLEEYALGYLKPIAYREAKRLYKRYRLHTRPDARRWKNWLVNQASQLYRKYAHNFDWDVAECISKNLSQHYGFEFDYYLSDGKACFVVRDGEDLDDDWEALYDDVVAGIHTGDFEYCRVVYAYSPSRRLLLCLHRTYVPIPTGGWALEWALHEEWEDVGREEAGEIAPN